jgi:hypothetical protein
MPLATVAVETPSFAAIPSADPPSLRIVVRRSESRCSICRDFVYSKGYWSFLGRHLYQLLTDLASHEALKNPLRGKDLRYDSPVVCPNRSDRGFPVVGGQLDLGCMSRRRAQGFFEFLAAREIAVGNGQKKRIWCPPVPKVEFDDSRLFAPSELDFGPCR